MNKIDLRFIKIYSFLLLTHSFKSNYAILAVHQ